MGNAAQAMALVHTAIDALQRALPGLPMGSELHTAVLRTVTELSRRTNNEQGDKGSQLQALAQMGHGLQANPQQQALQRMQPTAPHPPAMPS